MANNIAPQNNKHIEELVHMTGAFLTLAANWEMMRSAPKPVHDAYEAAINAYHSHFYRLTARYAPVLNLVNSNDNTP